MEQEQPNKFLIPLAIVVAGAMIAGAIYVGGGKQPNPSTSLGTSNQVKIAEVTEKDHIRGNPNAEVVIVEYSDTECPFCKVFHNTMKQVVNDYQGRVAWVYRHFPIRELHSKAIKESEATECVAELGGNNAFWTYLDKIFETTPSNDMLDPAELPRIAAAVGINETAFNECLSSGRYTERVEKSVEEAVKAGARGTPYSLIMVNGENKGIINGAEPLANVKAKIDALLK
jgi:protein-disulfide isomerase